MTVRLDHLHLRSHDPQQAAEFYINMFGAVAVAPVQTANGLRCIIDLQGLKLFIEQVPIDTPTAPKPPYLGLEHFGLLVENLDVLAAELKRKGAEFSTAPRRVNSELKMAFVCGPDRVIIELVERGHPQT